MASILGLSDSELSGIGKDNTIVGALQNFGNDVQEELRQSILDRQMQNSDLLGSSIVYDIQEESGLVSFELKMEDYGTFLDEGVAGVGGTRGDGTSWAQKVTSGRFSFKEGRRPPLFIDWANTKGINPFAVRESVFRKGIKQTKWYTETMEGKVDELRKRLQKAGAKEISISFEAGKFKGTTK